MLVGTGQRPDQVADDVALLGHRRADVVLDDLAQLAPPRVGIGDAVRFAGLEQRVALDRSGQPAIELGDGIGHRERRRRPAVRDALAQPLGQIAEVRGDPAELVGQRRRDLLVGEWQLRDADRKGGLQTEDRVDRELVEARRRRSALVGMKISISRVIRSWALSPVGGDRLGFCGDRATLGDLRVLGRPTRVLELPREPVVADEVGQRRVRSHREVVVARRERIEFFGRVGHLGTSRCVGWWIVTRMLAAMGA